MELKEVIDVLERYKSQSGHSGNIEALQAAISHLETLQEEKQLRIKYQDIVYQICRLFDITKDKCRIDEVVNKVKTIQELILGKKEG